MRIDKSFSLHGRLGPRCEARKRYHGFEVCEPNRGRLRTELEQEQVSLSKTPSELEYQKWQGLMSNRSEESKRTPC
jgi:hypothetical protein